MPDVFSVINNLRAGKLFSNVEIASRQPDNSTHRYTCITMRLEFSPRPPVLSEFISRRNQQKGNTFAFRHSPVRCPHGGQFGESFYDLTTVLRRVKKDDSRRICGF